MVDFDIGENILIHKSAGIIRTARKLTSRDVFISSSN